jgi:acyl carrier protein
MDALGVDLEEVTEQASIFNDLGAESIDLLDIIFRLQNKFQIKIRTAEFFPDTDQAFWFDEGLINANGFTRHGLQKLKELYPEIDLLGFSAPCDVQEVLKACFTPGYLTRWVSKRIS